MWRFDSGKINKKLPVIVYWQDAIIFDFKTKVNQLPLKMTIGKWFDFRGEFVVLQDTTTYKFDPKDKVYLPLKESQHRFFAIPLGMIKKIENSQEDTSDKE